MTDHATALDTVAVEFGYETYAEAEPGDAELIRNIVDRLAAAGLLATHPCPSSDIPEPAMSRKDEMADIAMPWMRDRNAADSDTDPLEEARSWARHGYEIGQRSCTWSDHGVAPKWLTGHWPLPSAGLQRSTPVECPGCGHSMPLIDGVFPRHGKGSKGKLIDCDWCGRTPPEEDHTSGVGSP
jgi:hypothetical protein